VSESENPAEEAKLLVLRNLCPAVNLPEELLALQRFHGHLGIYVTLGLRMGVIGKRTLGDYKDLRATVRTVPKPPMMCVVDGIQFASACTMGKGNIVIEPAAEPAVTFQKEGRRLTISLKPNLRETIDREMSHEMEIERSVFYFLIPEDDVFLVSSD
jgi:formylmethanofuran dehydrogenase subunit E